MTRRGVSGVRKPRRGARFGGARDLASGIARACREWNSGQRRHMFDLPLQGPCCQHLKIGAGDSAVVRPKQTANVINYLTRSSAMRITKEGSRDQVQTPSDIPSPGCCKPSRIRGSSLSLARTSIGARPHIRTFTRIGRFSVCPAAQMTPSLMALAKYRL